jgi:predicted amidohydrolase
MNFYGVQLDITWEDPQANFERVRKLLERTPPARGSLVALPEMFATGFSMNAAKIAEEIEGATASFLSQVAKGFGVTVIGGAALVCETAKPRNEALVFDPSGKRIARYCKLHPFTLGGERDSYAPGEEITTFKWNDFTVAPFVCYDLRFPEIFRRAVKRGATLMVAIANWPEARIGHWLTLLQARAIENQCYVIGVNRCGLDPTLRYPGRSIVVDPTGVIVADAGNQERVFATELDAKLVETIRTKLPFLPDMRDDLL